MLESLGQAVSYVQDTLSDSWTGMRRSLAYAMPSVDEYLAQIFDGFTYNMRAEMYERQAERSYENLMRFDGYLKTKETEQQEKTQKQVFRQARKRKYRPRFKRTLRDVEQMTRTLAALKQQEAALRYASPGDLRRTHLAQSQSALNCKTNDLRRMIKNWAGNAEPGSIFLSEFYVRLKSLGLV